MKASKKRRLKHDKFVDVILQTIAQAKGKIAPHRNLVLGVLGGMLVAFLVYAAAQAMAERETQNAWGAIQAEKDKLAKGEGEPDYAKLAGLYDGNRAEAWILYEWARHSLEEATRFGDAEGAQDRHAEVIRALEELRRKYPQHPLAERSTILLAQEYADRGDWKRASELYGAVAGSKSDYVDGFLKQKAKFGLAYAYEAQGDVPRAKQLYKDLGMLETNPWGDLARFRLERLSAASN